MSRRSFVCAKQVLCQFICSFAIVFLLVGTVLSQNRTLTDGYTPTGVAPGAPAGSFALSGFDQINLFNGNLNFNLPLLPVGGRGAAGYTLRLPIMWGWEVRREFDGTVGNWDSAIVRYNDIQAYSPGHLIGIRTSDRFESSLNCSVSQPVKTLTRLKFTAPDGTETYLIDEKYQGAQQPESLCNAGNPTGANRGKVFRSRDGGSMTFISDADILDDRHANFHWEISVSGYLLMRDGTRYRIDAKKVSWIRDRNGNKVSFEYEEGGSRLISITDSMNRQITITYGSCDQITYPGVGH